MNKRILMLLCAASHVAALNMTPSTPITHNDCAHKEPRTAVLRKKARGRILKSPDCGTHMSTLATAVAHTTGPVLELGMGDWSTPLLHALCSKDKRYLLSTETDKYWISLFEDLETDWHKFEYVPIFEKSISRYYRPEKWDAVGNEMRWSVVFIDHAPAERRLLDITRLRKNTDIFVVHDTEGRGYGLGPILDSFKYRYVEDRYTIETTVVSDTIDVTQFFYE